LFGQFSHSFPGQAQLCTCSPSSK